MSKQNAYGRLVDAVWGAAVGDALGVPYEFETRGDFECVGMVEGGAHWKPVGTWSDDTALLLATCDSIRACGHIDTHDMLSRFRNWWYRGRYTPDGQPFGIGNTTERALRSGRGGADEWDNGNGSLMRIAPLAFCDATDDEIREVSAITHAHHIAMDACVAFVGLLRDVANDPEGMRETCKEKVGGLSEEDIPSGGFVLDTLRAALWCFGTTDTYQDCVLKAVNLGSDSDTTACVAGALAGTAYGADSIPEDWRETLQGHDVLEATLF